MLLIYKPANIPLRYWDSEILSAVISLIIFAISAVLAINAFDFIQSASRANGVVVRQNAGRHHVQVRFQTAKGEVITYNQNGGIFYEASDKVTVLYNADNPRSGPSTDGFGALWEGAIMFALMGAFWMCIAWATIFRPHLVEIK